METFAKHHRLVPDVIEDFTHEPLLKAGLHHGASCENKRAMAFANISEGEEYFTLEIAVPGLTPADLAISLHDSTLTVCGQSPVGDTEMNVRRQEFVRGPFSRSFALPAYVDASAIDATCTNGILTLKLPKQEVDRGEPANIPIL